MKPVLETVVRSSPAVCSAYPAGEQQAEERAAGAADASKPANPLRGWERKRPGGDRKPDREEREERVDRDGVLDLDERHSPHRRDEDQRDESRHRAILSKCLG